MQVELQILLLNDLRFWNLLNSWHPNRKSRIRLDRNCFTWIDLLDVLVSWNFDLLIDRLLRSLNTLIFHKWLVESRSEWIGTRMSNAVLCCRRDDVVSTDTYFRLVNLLVKGRFFCDSFCAFHELRKWCWWLLLRKLFLLFETALENLSIWEKVLDNLLFVWWSFRCT